MSKGQDVRRRQTTHERGPPRTVRRLLLRPGHGLRRWCLYSWWLRRQRGVRGHLLGRGVLLSTAVAARQQACPAPPAHAARDPTRPVQTLSPVEPCAMATSTVFLKAITCVAAQACGGGRDHGAADGTHRTGAKCATRSCRRLAGSQKTESSPSTTPSSLAQVTEARPPHVHQPLQSDPPSQTVGGEPSCKGGRGQEGIVGRLPMSGLVGGGEGAGGKSASVPLLR